MTAIESFRLVAGLANLYSAYAQRQVPFGGFFACRLVMVVAIIGVVVAIAIPRIMRASKGAVQGSLRADLRTLRDAIELYAAEHGGVFPAQDKKEQTFVGQLTQRTDVDGEVGTTAGVHAYGPYLRKVPPVPVGPNAGAIGVKVWNDAAFKVQENIGGGTVGWCYNYETGEIIANTDDLDDDGKGYDTY